jgi:hypothetical protein
MARGGVLKFLLAVNRRLENALTNYLTPNISALSK